MHAVGVDKYVFQKLLALGGYLCSQDEVSKYSPILGAFIHEVIDLRKGPCNTTVAVMLTKVVQLNDMIETV